MKIRRCTYETGVHILSQDPESSECVECGAPIPPKILRSGSTFRGEHAEGVWNRAGRVAKLRRRPYIPELPVEAKPLDPRDLAILTEAQRAAEAAFAADAAANPDVVPAAHFAALVPPTVRNEEPGIDEWPSFYDEAEPIDVAKRRAGDDS